MEINEQNLINKIKTRIKDPKLYIDAPEAFKYKLIPPVSNDELVDAEKSLGFQLPALLQNIYLHIGNGGFGPGFGLLALNKKGANNYHMNLVDWYLERKNFSHPDYPNWPKQFITICDWGDCIVSEMDWTSPQASIYRFNGDQYGSKPFEEVMNCESPSLQKWLEDWVNNDPLYLFSNINKK